MRAEKAALGKQKAGTEEESVRQSVAAVVRKGATGTLIGRQPVRMRSRAAMALYLCFLKRSTRPLLQPSRGLGTQKLPSPPKSVFFVRLVLPRVSNHPSGHATACARN